MRRISKIHDDIYALMDSIKGFQTLRWALKRSEAQYKLTMVESHKSGIQLMLNIVILAAATRKETQSLKTKDSSVDKKRKQKEETKVPFLRQQSENLAYKACHAIVDLSEQKCSETDGPTLQPEEDSTGGGGEDNTLIHARVSEQSSDDTVDWLYQLAFKSYVESRKDSNSLNIDNKTSSNSDDATSLAVIRTPTELQTAIYEPGASSILVNELLADWTTLSEEEITRDTKIEPNSTQEELDAHRNPKEVQQNITFTDAFGRKFKFPFSRSKIWQVKKTPPVDTLPPKIGRCGKSS
ncbi:hypothetical protein IL306_008976 [Fusarium sp. DS 682]|nr:hypothetical protein IL306_008976 [Fusarium sp. DS 682]